MAIDILYLYVYCIWVSTGWQWSVDWHRNRKQAAQKEKRYTKKCKNNTNTQNTKQKTKQQEKRILKHKSNN